MPAPGGIDMASTWSSYGELAGIIGTDAAQVLCRAYGGVTLYIPKNIERDSALARIVGPVALRALASVYGGEVVTVPNRRKEAPRKGKILEMLAAGTPAREIALRLDVTQRYVEYVATAGKPKGRQGSLLDMM